MGKNGQAVEGVLTIADKLGNLLGTYSKNVRAHRGGKPVSNGSIIAYKIGDHGS